MIDQFEVGALYSNEDVYRSLGVGNAGGIRSKTDANGRAERLVIMTSTSDAKQEAENPYHDRVEGDTIIYTGAGRFGNQVLATGVNGRIPQQPVGRFPIYCFRQVGSRRDPKLGQKRWAFLGLLEYLRHYPEMQLDSKKEMRRALIFELRIWQIPVAVAQDSKLMEELLAQSTWDATTGADEREVIGAVGPDQQTAHDDQIALEGIRAKLLGYDPRGFELFLKALLLQSGFERVNVTRYSQDGGIDLEAIPSLASWPIRELLVQLQAKRWMHTVGRREVAEMRGSLMPHARGCIVTTSHYSRAAIMESAANGKVPIVLVDGYELAGIVRRQRFSLP